MTTDKPSSDNRFKIAPFLVLALILAGVAYVRLRLLQAPLERDEGEYAYMGQLMLKGLAPYGNAYTMKLPGVSAVYALFMALGGQSILSIHLGLFLTNGINIWLAYLLALRLLGREGALVCCAAYALLSLSYSVLGIFAHATHFVVLFSLAGFLLMFRYLDRGRPLSLLLSGICFGLAVLMKQHAVLLVGFGFTYLALHSWRRTGGKATLLRSALFVCGVFIPYALVVLYVVRAGAFEKFWFWTVQYARAYVSEMTLSQGWSYFYNNFTKIVDAQLPLFIAAGAGVYTLCARKKVAADRFFLFGFLAVNALAICPGWYFRPHYFVMLLPAVALMAGVAGHPSGPLLSAIGSQSVRNLALAGLLLTAALYACWQEGEYYFVHSPRQVSRACYAMAPFPEALPIAQYLREHTSPGDKIAIFGSEPEIFFYANRLSASRHIYMYGLMEDQPYAEKMRREMIGEIEASKPKYIVMVDVVSSWIALPTKVDTLINWAERYARENYQVVGIIDMIDYDTTHILWDADTKGYRPMGRDFLTVLRRNGSN